MVLTLLLHPPFGPGGNGVLLKVSTIGRKPPGFSRGFDIQCRTASAVPLHSRWHWALAACYVARTSSRKGPTPAYGSRPIPIPSSSDHGQTVHLYD